MTKELSADANLSHYRIVSKIGAGGMGEVYLANDTKLDRQVALKILPPEFAADKDRMSRFVREAKSASALNHPNIITIHEIGEADGTHFIATEFIDGKTLTEYAKANSLSYQAILEITIQIASALDEAHTAGIVHRDIKPDNIMIRPNGLVKILDFGIAKLARMRSADSGLRNEEAETLMQSPQNNPQSAIGNLQSTSPGMIIGTANYMSPEQAKGEAIDARTDIFSFGAVLYEMLVGHLPFEGQTPMEIIGAVIHKEPLPLDKNTPPEIERIVGKTLRKDRRERYQTIKDLLTDLKDVKQELEFQDKLEKTISPNKEEQKTQILKAVATFDEERQTATNENRNDGITIKKSGIGKAIIGIFAVLLVSVIGLGYWFYSKSNAKQIESIAVMPFVNESGNADVEYLSDGMTETLISSLSQLPNLSVKARSSVFRYKGKATDAQTIGRELNVQAILNGRVVQRGDQLTLNLELIDAQTENVIWSERYNRKQTNLVSLQNEIARDVSQKLKTKLSGADEQRLAKNYTTNPEAYNLYLQGRFFWNKRTVPDLQKSAEYFNQAIAIDQNYALAYAGLSDVYTALSERTAAPPREIIAKSREAAMKALLLDDNLAEAHTSLGAVLRRDFDFAGEEREYKRALELNPNYSTAHQWYGNLLSSLGRHEESLAEIRRALEIDPLSLIINQNYAGSLFFARRYDESIAQIKKTLELDPGYATAYIVLGNASQLKGDYPQSVEAYAKYQELVGKPEIAAAMRESFAGGGWRGYLRLMTGENRPANFRTHIVATFYAALGEKDKAFAELNKAYEERDNLSLLKTDPRLDSLRGDPRFEELLRKVGFPQ